VFHSTTARLSDLRNRVPYLGFWWHCLAVQNLVRKMLGLVFHLPDRFQLGEHYMLKSNFNYKPNFFNRSGGLGEKRNAPFLI
jgi:hypothetical protein